MLQGHSPVTDLGISRPHWLAPPFVALTTPTLIRYFNSAEVDFLSTHELTFTGVNTLQDFLMFV